MLAPSPRQSCHGFQDKQKIMSADVNPFSLTLCSTGEDYSSGPMAASVDPRFTCEPGEQDRRNQLVFQSEQKQWNSGNSICQISVRHQPLCQRISIATPSHGGTLEGFCLLDQLMWASSGETAVPPYMSAPILPLPAHSFVQLEDN